jgi:hypothetical protein
MTRTRPTAILAALVSPLVVAAEPRAEAPPATFDGGRTTPSDGLRADVEVDPLAYLLEGYSLHVGLGWRRLRLDLGAYAAALPRAFHRHDDLDVSFDGYGIKLQVFPFAEQSGGFGGIEVGVLRQTVGKPGTQLAVRDSEIAVGVQLGWRFDLAGDLYVTPWLGVSRGLDREAVTVDGSTYRGSPVNVFPAVHLGYRLR